eukprot:scaffold434743_cov15-Prasinocladus_malaysianus.AAC.1
MFLRVSLPHHIQQSEVLCHAWSRKSEWCYEGMVSSHSRNSAVGFAMEDAACLPPMFIMSGVRDFVVPWYASSVIVSAVMPPYLSIFLTHSQC